MQERKNATLYFSFLFNQLGYGARGSAPEIPPHAVLEFDIKLLAVK